MRRRQKQNRKATATVEMAICLPVLLTLTIATIDVCTAMFLKESLSIAAYEGARTGVVRGGTNAQVQSRIQEILDERGVNYEAGQLVSITPVSFENADTLEHLRVEVRVPYAGNLLSPAQLFTSGNMEAYVWMRKEYRN